MLQYVNQLFLAQKAGVCRILEKITIGIPIRIPVRKELLPKEVCLIWRANKIVIRMKYCYKNEICFVWQPLEGRRWFRRNIWIFVDVFLWTPITSTSTELETKIFSILNYGAFFLVQNKVSKELFNKVWLKSPLISNFQLYKISNRISLEFFELTTEIVKN